MQLVRFKFDPSPNKKYSNRMLIKNKKAFFNYAIKDTLEAGICLIGCEVKSIRNGHATIHESYIRIKNNEVYLVNANILPYEQGNRQNPNPTRDRKLLLHQKQILNLINQLERQGLTAVPTKMYLKKRRIKIEIAIGSPKKKFDKRASIKDRELTRSLNRSFKNKTL
jgi:SsrA-binding protein